MQYIVTDANDEHSMKHKVLDKSDHVLVTNVPTIIPQAIFTPAQIVSMFKSLPRINVQEMMSHIEQVWVSQTLADDIYDIDYWTSQQAIGSIFIDTDKGEWVHAGYNKCSIRVATSEEIEISNTFYTLRKLFIITRM